MACSISEEVERVDKDFHLQSKAARAMKAYYLLSDSTAGVPSCRDYFGDQGECSTEHVFLSTLSRAVIRKKNWHTYPGVSRWRYFLLLTYIHVLNNLKIYWNMGGKWRCCSKEHTKKTLVIAGVWKRVVQDKTAFYSKYHHWNTFYRNWFFIGWFVSTNSRLSALSHEYKNSF
jgi:hypothetical protein